MKYLITEISFLNSNCLLLQECISNKCLIPFHITLLDYKEIDVFTVFLFLLEMT